MFSNTKTIDRPNISHENQLVEDNLGLVVHIARRYRSPHFSLDDLISIGLIGLIKATRTYRPDQGALFSTYACRCITNEILMFLRKNKKHLEAFSLDAPIRTADDTTVSTIASLLCASDDGVEGRIERMEERRALLNAVAHLSPRSQALISMRYGLNGQKKLSQTEIASRLGISQSYVSRLEKQCLHRLRRMLS